MLTAIRPVSLLDRVTSAAVRMMLLARSVEAWNPWEHARWPKGHPNAGKFAPMMERLKSAVREFNAGRGGGRKSPLEGFSRDQLMKAAKDAGIELGRGEGEESIARKLMDKLNAVPPKLDFSTAAGTDDVLAQAYARTRQSDADRLRGMSRAEGDKFITAMSREERRFLAEDLGLPVGASKKRMLDAAGGSENTLAAARKALSGKDYSSNTSFNPNVAAAMEVERLSVDPQPGDADNLRRLLGGFNLDQLKDIQARVDGAPASGRTKKAIVDALVGKLGGESPAGAKPTRGAADLPTYAQMVDPSRPDRTRAGFYAELQQYDLTDAEAVAFAKRLKVPGTGSMKTRDAALRGIARHFGAGGDLPGEKPRFDSAEVAERISALGSGADIESALAGLNLTQLRRVAREFPISGVNPALSDRDTLRANIASGIMRDRERFHDPRRRQAMIDAATPVPFDASSTAAALRETVASRADGEAMVAAMRKPELVELGRELSLPGAASMSMARLRREIVEGTVGRRLDSQATRGFKANMPGGGGAGPTDFTSRSQAAATKFRAGAERGDVGDMSDAELELAASHFRRELHQDRDRVRNREDLELVQTELEMRRQRGGAGPKG